MDEPGNQRGRKAPMRQDVRLGGSARAHRTRDHYRNIAITRPLYIPEYDARYLLERQGPSLALWRAAEVAALREQTFQPPILDLGCGDGIATAVALRGQNGVIGVDPDASILEQAAQTGVYESLLAAPMEDLGERDVPSGSIGTVLSNSVLEHLPRLDATLAAVTRVLRPGGRLIFTVPTEIFSRWLLLPCPRYAAWRNRALMHRNLEPIQSWRGRLERAGLALDTVRPYLRHRLVTLWDALDLSQQLWIGRQRVASLLWRHLPERAMDALAHRLAATNLAASGRSGGRLLVARRVG